MDDEPVTLILPPHYTMVGSSNASDKHIAATWYHPSKLGPPLHCTDHKVLLFRLPTGHDSDQSPTTYVASKYGSHFRRERDGTIVVNKSTHASWVEEKRHPLISYHMRPYWSKQF